MIQKLYCQALGFYWCVVKLLRFPRVCEGPPDTEASGSQGRNASSKLTRVSHIQSRLCDSWGSRI